MQEDCVSREMKDNDYELKGRERKGQTEVQTSLFRFVYTTPGHGSQFLEFHSLVTHRFCFEKWNISF
jgi:hypothetical protein